MNRIAAVWVLAVVLAVAALSGCAGDGARGKVDSPADPAASPTVALTPILSEVGYVVTAESGPAYEVRMRIFGEPVYDMDAGTLAFTTDHEVNGVQTLEFSPSDLGCDYTSASDLVIPVQFTFENLGTENFTSPDSFVGAVLDVTTGFDDPWFYYTTVLRLIDVASGECSSIGIDSESETIGSADLGMGVETFSPGGPGMNELFVVVHDGKKMDDARLAEFLAALAWRVDVTSPVFGEPYTFEFTDPEQSRVLGDACGELYVPMSLETTNPRWSTLGDAGCDVKSFH